MKKYILALDEGTTSARSILFDSKMNVVSMAQQEFPQYYPQAGWVEQDPMEIYATQYASLTECIAKSGVSPEEVAGIGITNQRESITRLSGSAAARRISATGSSSRVTENISAPRQVLGLTRISAQRK